jgi:hypothetical protein
MDFTNDNGVKYTQYVLVGRLCIFSSLFMIGELAMKVDVKCKLWRLHVHNIISVVITIGFIVLRVLMGNTWYIIDILGINNY